MIPLYVDKGTAFVWSSDDWFQLRSKYRICGSLSSSLPSFPRQNDFFGLPMALMSEEAALLVEKGICEMYELPKITEPPTDNEIQELKMLEEKVLEEQKEALKNRKIEQLSQKIDIILAGKRQKLLSKGVTDFQLEKQTLLQEEINKLQDVAAAHILVHIPTEHFRSTEKINIGLECLVPSVLNGEGAIRYAVFKDMWEKGHYITSGSKFGSAYLLYPGDPVKFHATYMVRCICDEIDNFRPASMVAFGRLSVAVNKLAVLAYCTNGKVQYQTLRWHDSIKML